MDHVREHFVGDAFSFGESPLQRSHTCQEVVVYLEDSCIASVASSWEGNLCCNEEEASQDSHSPDKQQLDSSCNQFGVQLNDVDYDVLRNPAHALVYPTASLPIWPPSTF